MNANVDAMNWSLLNSIAHTIGLSRDCNVEVQYDDRTTSTTLHNYGLLRRRRRQRERNLVVTTTTTSPTNGSSNAINSLPYPTSIYQIATNSQATQIEGTYIRAEDDGMQSLKSENSFRWSYINTCLSSIHFRQIHVIIWFMMLHQLVALL